MLFFITIFAFVYCIFAFEPSCASCKHFIPNVKLFNDLGLCRMFKNEYYNKGASVMLPNYAVHCRENENLCGKEGVLYEPIDTDVDKHVQDEIYEIEEQAFKNKILFDIDELNNKCCGEINEKEEIEELEKEFGDILEQIKKHNTKNNYKTQIDLFKLFKRNNK